MAYQKPKADHPWKTGHMRDESKVKVEKKSVKPLRIFIQEISESWDDVRVVTSAYSTYGEFKLGELSEEKQAAWLAGILRRHYA